jgi:hypothetical protein
VVQNAAGAVVTDVGALETGAPITARLAVGRFAATVDSISAPDPEDTP